MLVLPPSLNSSSVFVAVYVRLRRKLCDGDVVWAAGSRGSAPSAVPSSRRWCRGPSPGRNSRGRRTAARLAISWSTSARCGGEGLLQQRRAKSSLRRHGSIWLGLSGDGHAARAMRTSCSIVGAGPGLGLARGRIRRPHVEVGVGPLLPVLDFVLLGLGHVDGGGRGGQVVIALALITLAMPFMAEPAAVVPPPP